jgi:hypothetical protein
MGTPVESVTETRADNSLIEAAAQIQAAVGAISAPSRPGALAHATKSCNSLPRFDW